MFGSQVIEVGIGLAFVYLLLSMLCSVISEWIAGRFALRAQNLEEGMRSLFTDGKLADGTALSDAIYKHGLVQSLFRSGGSKPAYIPSEVFASTLLTVLVPADGNPFKGVEAARLQRIEGSPMRAVSA